RGGADARRSVVLTFDDGGRDQLRAAEIMERHGFRGIFFVIPAVGSVSPGRMTPEDVRRLARAGHRVAVHGYRHRSMVDSGAETAASVARSAGVLRERLPERHPMHDFAFPFGHYTEEIAEAVGERYRYLHTVNPGYWDGRSPLVPRMLLAGEVPLAFYQEYLLGAGGYRPPAALLGPDGASGDVLRFRLAGALPEGEIAMLSISADREGRMYSVHPLGDAARVEGDTLVVELREHLRRHFPPERRVVSYALVTRTPAGIRYLTPGYSQWVE
ncbi:MAG TPA: polysaccharide deacetylase family protein, partial [Longimicrobiaceae bacterium]